MQPPGSISPARWYHLAGTTQHGPVQLVEIRQLVLTGTVEPDTYVWADGMPDWLPAAQVPALVPPADVRHHLVAWS